MDLLELLRIVSDLQGILRDELNEGFCALLAAVEVPNVFVLEVLQSLLLVSDSIAILGELTGPEGLGKDFDFTESGLAFVNVKQLLLIEQEPTWDLLPQLLDRLRIFDPLKRLLFLIENIPPVLHPLAHHILNLHIVPCPTGLFNNLDLIRPQNPVFGLAGQFLVQGRHLAHVPGDGAFRAQIFIFHVH